MIFRTEAGALDQKLVPCPYGAPGDRLWVRETWAADHVWDDLKPRDIPQGEPILYKADGHATGVVPFEWGKARPSIFLPKWASRITLENVSIRVERLREISEADAEAEGVQFLREVPDADESLTAVQLYQVLWEHINGPGSWDANPWVWVVEFKRVTLP